MLIASFASDTIYGRFCHDLVRTIVASARPDFLAIEAESVRDMADQVAGRRVPGILVLSCRPESDLLQIAGRLHGRTILFDEYAEDLAGNFLRQKRFTWPVALQHTCAFLCTTAPVRKAGGPALTVLRRPGLTLRMLLATILQVLEMPMEPAKLVEAAARIDIRLPQDLDRLLDEVLLERDPAITPAGAGIQELTMDAVELMRNIYEPIVTLINGGEARPIIWPVEIFFAQTEKKAVSGVRPEPQTMLGPARFLYFGPYLCLPAGRWQAMAEFEVKNNLSRNRVEIDISRNNETISFSLVDLPEEGFFTAVTDFFNDRGELPIEMRIFLKEGAIEGQFELKKVMLTPISEGV
ncbi:MAG: hypothetical protein O9322_04240 [Beijerinckiaceae bacterium]|nr:hypothetical protein [Beijerinckiaceae bacterium]MCZ8298729.1 hypothetical protein [Beijerinckiaceae bacterium]